MSLLNFSLLRNSKKIWNGGSLKSYLVEVMFQGKESIRFLIILSLRNKQKVSKLKILIVFIVMIQI